MLLIYRDSIMTSLRIPYAVLTVMSCAGKIINTTITRMLIELYSSVKYKKSPHLAGFNLTN